MESGWARHIFPGGNTAYGFYSFYGEILRQEDAERIIVLKGGPGVGKSTFLKRIGEAALQKGLDTEFLHCSSDNNSLDGIHIPGLKTAVIDGTAPHVVDPKTPAAVDEILNFGDFWDAAGIRKSKAAILSLTGSISACFARAYRYLKAARAVAEDSEAIYGSAADTQGMAQLAGEVTSELFRDEDFSEKPGRTRKLFLSAITPNGLLHYIDDSIVGHTVYAIKGALGLKACGLLEKIRTEASLRGYDTEAFYCALDPAMPEHLIIPAKKTAFITVNEYHTPRLEVWQIADLASFLDKAEQKKREGDLAANRALFNKLLDEAVVTIGRAKEMHDELETYYKPHIDFAAVDRCLQKTLKSLLT
jgi:hypothetical protein